MAGSGINENTLAPLLKVLLPAGLREIHLSGGEWVASDMVFKRSGMGMGIDGDAEWGIWRTQDDQVRKVREISDSMWNEFIATRTE